MARSTAWRLHLERAHTQVFVGDIGTFVHAASPPTDDSSTPRARSLLGRRRARAPSARMGRGIAPRSDRERGARLHGVLGSPRKAAQRPALQHQARRVRRGHPRTPRGGGDRADGRQHPAVAVHRRPLARGARAALPARCVRSGRRPRPWSSSCASTRGRAARATASAARCCTRSRTPPRPSRTSCSPPSTEVSHRAGSARSTTTPSARRSA